MDDTHHLDFVVLTDNHEMKKIGQYPSVADLTFPELKQYQKVSSQQDMKEIRRAIGLYAQGIGVGSYVYMRRILERLIYKVQEKAITVNIYSAADFTNKKVSERITMLKKYLPDMLVNNTTIYGIVSKGIHELSEEDCILYFPVVKDVIYMILEQWEQKRKKEEREKLLSSSLSKIAGEVK